ncbi:MAG: SBBP repeat-containing protein [Flavobacteriales bacterium]|nr:SBBP repeat-containing protein [Flavobacteriales bacterium]
MKRKLLPALFILFFNGSYAQILAEGRLLHVDGSSYGYSITTDLNENIIISGEVDYSSFNMVNVDFDPGPDEALINVVGSSDGFVCKLDPNGNYLWVVRLGGDESTSEWAQDVAADSDGNIYVAGNFSNTCDFDPSGELFQLYDTNTDGYLLKLSPDGDLIWVREISSPGAVRAHGLTISPNGHIIISGFLSPETFVGDPSNALPSDADGGFVSAFDPSGNVQWTKVFQSSTTCNVVKIATDSNDNLYGIGIYNGTFDVDPGPGIIEMNADGSDDGFFFKLDASGNLLWNGSFGSTAEDWGYDIAVSQNDEVYLTGHFKGDMTIHSTNDDLTIPVQSASDALFARIDTDGQLIWAHGVATDGRGHAVSTNLEGEPFFTGYFSGTTDFDPGQGSSIFISVDESDDMFVVHYTAAGALVDAYAVSGTYGQLGRGIHVDSHTVFVTGQTGGNADLDPGDGVIAASSAGGVSFYLKLEPTSASGIIENNLQSNMYPNPVRRGQFIHIPGFQGLARVLDLSGRECLRWNIQWNENVEVNLESGQYQIECLSDEGRKVVRLIVQ